MRPMWMLRLVALCLVVCASAGARGAESEALPELGDASSAIVSE